MHIHIAYTQISIFFNIYTRIFSWPFIFISRLYACPRFFILLLIGKKCVCVHISLHRGGEGRRKVCAYIYIKIYIVFTPSQLTVIHRPPLYTEALIYQQVPFHVSCINATAIHYNMARSAAFSSSLPMNRCWIPCCKAEQCWRYYVDWLQPLTF